MVDRLVKVYASSGHLEAHVIKGRLESEGIPVLLRYESASLVYGMTLDGLGQVEILVPQHFAPEAERILSSLRSETQEV